jgi:hypothetical protein
MPSIEEINTLTEELLYQFDELSVRGSGWSGNTRRGFMYDPTDLAGVSVVGFTPGPPPPPVSTCPTDCPVLTLNFAGVSFSCGCDAFDQHVTGAGPFFFGPGFNGTNLVVGSTSGSTWAMNYANLAVEYMVNWSDCEDTADIGGGVGLAVQCVTGGGWTVSAGIGGSTAPYLFQGSATGSLPITIPNSLTCDLGSGQYSMGGSVTITCGGALGSCCDMVGGTIAAYAGCSDDVCTFLGGVFVLDDCNGTCIPV